jgi:hypothetical protein
VHLLVSIAWGEEWLEPLANEGRGIFVAQAIFLSLSNFSFSWAYTTSLVSLPIMILTGMQFL